MLKSNKKVIFVSLECESRAFESRHLDQKYEITPISWTFMLQFMGVIFYVTTFDCSIMCLLNAKEYTYTVL